jgi:imidazolonepropionase-like amidohydrolase
VVVHGERIAAVGTADHVKIPAGAEQINLSNATLL